MECVGPRRSRVWCVLACLRSFHVCGSSLSLAFSLLIKSLAAGSALLDLVRVFRVFACVSLHERMAASGGPPGPRDLLTPDMWAKLGALPAGSQCSFNKWLLSDSFVASGISQKLIDLKLQDSPLSGLTTRVRFCVWQVRAVAVGDEHKWEYAVKAACGANPFDVPAAIEAEIREVSFVPRVGGGVLPCFVWILGYRVGKRALCRTGSE